MADRADGSVEIEALLTTNKFDRQIAQLEKKIEAEEKKKQLNLQTKSTQESALEREQKQTDALADKYEELLHYKKQYEKAMKVTEKASITSKEYQNAMMTELELGPLLHGPKGDYQKITELEQQLGKAVSKEEALQQKIADTEKNYQGIVNKIDEYKNKIATINLQKQQAETEKLKNNFKGIASSIQSAAKKAGSLVLGIFAIRSAYLALRRASSDLAQYDEQYAANLEYIKYALTQAIAPVLRAIVSLALQLLQVINMILNALFGINIFANGSAESFNKMKAGASGVSKAVKEIKKQLAGFDEINMLTDQSDTGTAGGAGGVGMPSIDLSDLQGEPPEWLKWIIDHKGEIIAVLAGIAGGLAGIKLGLDPITSLGLAGMIGGLVYALEGVMDYLDDPSWKNFGKVVQGIGAFVIGLGVAFLGLPAIIVGVCILIVGTIIKYWDQIKEALENGIKWLEDKSDWVHEMFGDVIGDIYDYFVAQLKNGLDFLDKTFNSIKQIFDGLIDFITGIFTGDWEKAFNGLKKIASGFLDLILNKIKFTIDQVKEKVVLIAKVAGDLFGDTFKRIINAVLSTIERLLNKPIEAINKAISFANNLPGVQIGHLSTFNFPRLKQGAILNVPNKGTLVGGGRAIAGEAGHEGIIPLTDQQAMAELGREIGKNVLINLTNIMKVGNRQIAREIKQINADTDFAYNT